MAPFAASKKDRFGGLDIPFTTKLDDQYIQPQFALSAPVQKSSTHDDRNESKSEYPKNINDSVNKDKFEYQNERQKILDLAVGRLPGIIQVMARANKNLGNTPGSEIEDLSSIWERGSEILVPQD